MNKLRVWGSSGALQSRCICPAVVRKSALIGPKVLSVSSARLRFVRAVCRCGTLPPGWSCRRGTLGVGRGGCPFWHCAFVCTVSSALPVSFLLLLIKSRSMDMEKKNGNKSGRKLRKLHVVVWTALKPLE